MLFVHGILSTSEQFLMNGPALAPGYILADTGKFDVWFLNMRGNSYSKHHNFYDASSSTEYWQFSFEEVGDFDIPATVDYIHKVTSKPVGIISFSQGTTATFAALARNRHLFEGKVTGYIAIAPVTTLKYSNSGMLMTLAEISYLGEVLNRYQYLEVFNAESRSADSAVMVGSMCSFFPRLCQQTFNMLAETRIDLCNPDKLDLYMQHWIDSGSLKNLIHMSQIVQSGKFQRYDYGLSLNLRKYGSQHPPLIDLSLITYLPVALLVGKYDSLATVEDNKGNRQVLGDAVKFYKEYEKDHLSFVLGRETDYFREDVVPLLEEWADDYYYY